MTTQHDDTQTTKAIQQEGVLHYYNKRPLQKIRMQYKKQTKIKNTKQPQQKITISLK